MVGMARGYAEWWGAPDRPRPVGQCRLPWSRRLGLNGDRDIARGGALAAPAAVLFAV